MRRLVWLIAVLAVMWSAWWALASAGLQQATSNWFEDQRRAGWQAEVGEISQHGFPFTLNARLRGISVADPTTGVSFNAPRLDLKAAAYWPGYMTVELPNAPLEIATPTGRFTLETRDAQADLRLHPGVTLQLKSMGFMSGAWHISQAGGGFVSAESLQMAVTQDDAIPEIYQINLDAKTLTPGDVIRDFLALPIDWPVAFDAFTADLNVAFDVPWDRNALTSKRPQPRAVTARRIEASWGDVRLSASGDLTIDPSGIPTGEISMALTNWRKVIDVAQASGALPDAQRTQAEVMLSALANMGGGPNDLDLVLSFQNSEMSLGPIRLGPAPRLILR